MRVHGDDQRRRRRLGQRQQQQQGRLRGDAAAARGGGQLGDFRPHFRFCRVVFERSLSGIMELKSQSGICFRTQKTTLTLFTFECLAVWT